MALQIKAILAGGAAALALAAAGAAVYWAPPSFLKPAPAPVIANSPPPPPASAKAENAPGPSAAEPAPSSVEKPAFDVVNVEPTGEAVIAGRAAPNARVELRDGSQTIAVATANSAGEFVVIPSPLSPGDHKLSLAERSPSGSASSKDLAVTVPAPETRVAALAPAQPPGNRPPAAAIGLPAASPAAVAVKSVEASAGGKLIAIGSAPPNATVRLYLSGAFVGDAKALADGRWSLTIKHGMTSGAYEIRADEINPASAAVVARAQAPFDYPASAASAAVGADVAAEAASPTGLVVDEVQIHHVETGHTLWGISQKFYGDGSRYQLIFAANSGQIRNPNLIYPGQVFVLSKPEPPKP